MRILIQSIPENAALTQELSLICPAPDSAFGLSRPGVRRDSIALRLLMSPVSEPSSSSPSRFPGRRRFSGIEAGSLLAEGLRGPAPQASTVPVAASWQPPETAKLEALLGDEYAILRLIGRGGMGAVYEVRHRVLERRAALKIVPPEIADLPGFAARFRSEARLTASLEHPGIVRVFDSGETVDGCLWYAMEYIEGEDLAQRLRSGACSPAEAVQILTGMAAALEHAHSAGVLHRDIKPANILLPAGGGVKLSDFGLALPLGSEQDRLTRIGSTVGTVEYAAPEQLSRSGGAGVPADIYSLGVVAYELLTGELPRGVFDPPSARNAAVDPAFDGPILRALQSDPSRRYATAAAFGTALRNAAGRQVREDTEKRRARQRLARRARLAAAFAVLMLLFAGLAYYAWKSRDAAAAGRSAAQKAEAETDGIIRFLLTDLRRTLERTGNLAAMDAAMERAVQHYRQRSAAGDHSPESVRNLAEVLSIKAAVIGNRGMIQEADALLSEALTLQQEARTKSSPGLEPDFSVMQAWLNRAEFRMTAGRQKDALADARMVVSEAEAAHQASPSPVTLRWKAAGWRAVGHALAYTGPMESAAAAYQTASTLFHELPATGPGSATRADDLASIDLALGSLEETLGNFPRMLEHFSAWHGYVKSRCREGDLLYSHSCFRVGLALTKNNRPAEAVPLLENAVRIAEHFASLTPGEKGALNHLSHCLLALSQACRASGANDAAATAEQRRAEVQRRLTAPP